MALGLQIDPEEFLQQHSEIFNGEVKNASAVRLLHYPPLNDVSDSKITRCGKHTDYGGLTLLFQVSKVEFILEYNIFYTIVVFRKYFKQKFNKCTILRT